VQPSALEPCCQNSIERFDLPVGCRGLRPGRTPKVRGVVEAVVLTRGEVRLDRDAAVFDVPLHDGQYSVSVVRARFLQVLEGQGDRR
jgi:hypothetical protein